MAEPPGASIGPYRLVGPIGSGGFATVYRARDERFDCDVAIKVLAENHALDPDIRERFLTEAQLLRVVDSPHVVHVYDVGETERHQPYLVLEYAARGTLGRRVAELRRAGWSPSPNDIARLARTLAEGLAAMHAHDLVHRDVSPGNLLVRVTDATVVSEDGELLGRDERLLLSDLGYAKDLRAHSGLTVGGGTQGFNAPEQRLLGRVDRRADVYAASALLAWLLTGTEPAHANGDDPSSALRQRGVPAPLAAALGTGLAEDPDARPPDMNAWHATVRVALDRTSQPAALAPTPRRAARARRWIAGAVAMCLATAIGGVLAGRHWSGRESTASVTRLSDGRTRVAAARGSVAVAIFGPATVPKGKPASFEAGIRGASSYQWITPDGRNFANAPSIDVTFTTVGEADLVLAATAPDGHQASVVFPVRVTA